MLVIVVERLTHTYMLLSTSLSCDELIGYCYIQLTTFALHSNVLRSFAIVIYKATELNNICKHTRLVHRTAQSYTHNILPSINYTNMNAIRQKCVKMGETQLFETETVASTSQQSQIRFHHRPTLKQCMNREQEICGKI